MQALKRLTQRVLSVANTIGGMKRDSLESLFIDMRQRVEFPLGKKRGLQLHQTAVLTSILEHIAVIAQI